MYENEKETQDNTSISIYLKILETYSLGQQRLLTSGETLPRQQQKPSSTPVIPALYIIIHHLSFFCKAVSTKMDPKISTSLRERRFCCCSPHRNQEKEVDRGHLKTIAILEGQFRSGCLKNDWSHIVILPLKKCENYKKRKFEITHTNQVLNKKRYNLWKGIAWLNNAYMLYLDPRVPC